MKPLLATDPQMIGDFRLSDRLGSGAMGQVYLGYSKSGRSVAVKVVHSHLADDEEFRERFRHEVEAASKVNGIYAASVVASGVDDNPPWLATAYVPGPSLAVLVNSYGPLSEDATWRLAAGLAEALGNVHDAGLVHRDLKPSNVLIAPDGPRVIDFGIARAFEGTQLTSPGMVIGTPGYMAPEQAGGLPASHASDIFSLGCVLAYAATGRPPFGFGGTTTILSKAAFSGPDLGQVSPALRQIIQACLRKAPEDRPGLTELESMIADARPPAHSTPGLFWPEPVASQIAAAQSEAPPETRTSAADLRNNAPTSTSARDSDPVPPDSSGGRERLSSVAVPRTVREAVRLMYFGFAATAVDVVFSLITLSHYLSEVSQDQRASLTQAQHTANSMAGAMTIGVAADVAGLIGWIWFAAASHRGAGWTAAAGTALLVLYSICTLVIELVTRDDLGPQVVTAIVWATGLAVAMLLWSPSARAFSGRSRKR